MTAQSKKFVHQMIVLAQAVYGAQNLSIMLDKIYAQYLPNFAQIYKLKTH